MVGYNTVCKRLLMNGQHSLFSKFQLLLLELWQPVLPGQEPAPTPELPSEDILGALPLAGTLTHTDSCCVSHHIWLNTLRTKQIICVKPFAKFEYNCSDVETLGASCPSPSSR